MRPSTARRVALIASSCANLGSIARALRAIDATVEYVSEPTALRDHSHVILPGVGAFDAGVEAITPALFDALREHVGKGRQLFGICLGMQLLFERSAEGKQSGLGLLPGAIERLPEFPDCKVPHIGWNEIEHTAALDDPLWMGITSGTHVYYVHSFGFRDVEAEFVKARTTHGAPFAAVVTRDNVHGAQFHPEKSGPAGLRLLANFLALDVLVKKS